MDMAGLEHGWEGRVLAPMALCRRFLLVARTSGSPRRFALLAAEPKICIVLCEIRTVVGIVCQRGSPALLQVINFLRV